MKKEYYDHRSIKCPQCYWHSPPGKKPDDIVSPDEEWKEACRRYGYSFDLDRYPEDAEDCDGFETLKEHQLRNINANILNKRKRK